MGGNMRSAKGTGLVVAAIVASIVATISCSKEKAAIGESCEEPDDCAAGECFFDPVGGKSTGECVHHCTCAAPFCLDAPECPTETCLPQQVDPKPRCVPRCDGDKDCPAGKQCEPEHFCRFVRRTS